MCLRCPCSPSFLYIKKAVHPGKFQIFQSSNFVSIHTKCVIGNWRRAVFATLKAVSGHEDVSKSSKTSVLFHAKEVVACFEIVLCRKHFCSKKPKRASNSDKLNLNCIYTGGCRLIRKQLCMHNLKSQINWSPVVITHRSPICYSACSNRNSPESKF